MFPFSSHLTITIFMPAIAADAGWNKLERFPDDKLDILGNSVCHGIGVCANGCVGNLSVSNLVDGGGGDEEEGVVGEGSDVGGSPKLNGKRAAEKMAEACSSLNSGCRNKLLGWCPRTLCPRCPDPFKCASSGLKWAGICDNGDGPPAADSLRYNATCLRMVLFRGPRSC